MKAQTKRGILAAAGGLMLGAFSGCASPAQIAQTANRYEAKAAYLDANGDHFGAQRAREAAAKQRVKAAERSTWYY